MHDMFGKKVVIRFCKLENQGSNVPQMVITGPSSGTDPRCWFLNEPPKEDHFQGVRITTAELKFKIKKQGRKNSNGGRISVDLVG